MDLALLSAQLQYCYNAAAVTDADDLMVYCPVIGQAYVACGDDNLWYRVQVIGESRIVVHSCLAESTAQKVKRTLK